MAKKELKNKGDQQAEAIGLAVIDIVKGVARGFKALVSNKAGLVAFLIVTVACVAVFTMRDAVIARILTPEYEGFHIVKILVPGIIAFPFIILYAAGSSPEKQDEFEEKFRTIGFSGKNGEFPKFLGKEDDGKKVIYSFKTPGITLIEWRKQQEQLETALDCNIVKIELANGTKQVIRIHTVPTPDSEEEMVNGISTNILWHNSYLREKDFEIVVGRTILGDVVFNLNKVPHGLLAGVTGSGKSVLLRCILGQFVFKSAKLYMFDFKGGVEFGKEFERFGEVVTERQTALEILKELTLENKLRLKLFRESGVKNIVEYNKAFPDQKLCRIGLFCDEISEMLDKTGLAAADKAIFYEIEKELSTLARLSRATGINMILATQRPDAKVLAGQIKNNLPIRICGRMVDSQASEMVLGNTKASYLSETLGRFLYNIGSDTYEFQAFNFDDSCLNNVLYQQEGEMLLDQISEDELSLIDSDQDGDVPEEEPLTAGEEMIDLQLESGDEYGGV